jgi:hypothetical protein
VVGGWRILLTLAWKKRLGSLRGFTVYDAIVLQAFRLRTPAAVRIRRSLVNLTRSHQVLNELLDFDEMGEKLVSDRQGK